MLERSKLVFAAVVATIVAATIVLDWGGYLARLEHGMADWRARLLAHSVESGIVIVGIDAHSLQELSEWPWPRRHHARLLQLLRSAAPSRVFVDIDFSAHSSAEDDALFERALADWPESPVMLATHFQPLRQSSSEIAVTRPLPRFSAHAVETSVMLRPSGDGLVREMQSSWPLDHDVLHAVFSHGSDLPVAASVAIDFSIRPESFGYVSFSDLINGEIAPAGLRGKQIFVGATAVELNDIVAVPVYQALPGVVVQALATETVKHGLIVVPPRWVELALLGMLAIGYACFAGAQGWRRGAVALGAACAALCVATLSLYAYLRIDLSIVPAAVALLGIFIATALRSLDRETWRALGYAIGLRRQDALLTSIVESSSDCIVCMDATGAVRTANAAAHELFCKPGESIVGAGIERSIPGLTGDKLAGMTGALHESEALRPNGGIFPIELAVSRVAFDQEQLFTAIVRDISERRAQQRKLEHQAMHDALTGLPNRAALTAHLARAFEKTSRRKKLALLMLDLCRFKEVNDTLGHDVGDQVLREVAQRFASALGARAFVSRIGGDEFTVVIDGIETLAAIDTTVDVLTGSVKLPINVRGIAIEVGLSIGVALSPDHSRDPQELLRHADVAMYVAKRRGTAMEYYERQQDLHTVRRLSMVSELRAGIEKNEVELHYQPQVNLQTGCVDGVEALLRWRHPMLGTVNPAEFVALAESTELITPLTDWTLERALRDQRSWRGQLPNTRFAVNLSARVLQDASFAARLARLLSRFAVDPGLLELEITESAMMLDPDRARRTVHELRGLGVQISIDDYGTGFSSLGYLRDLQAHALKLDKSFVIDLEKLEHNRVIVESTAQLAHALGMQIVAEGVETQWVQDYLTNAGYDLGQGYKFSRPLGAADCFAWLTAFNAPRQRAV